MSLRHVKRISVSMLPPRLLHMRAAVLLLSLLGQLLLMHALLLLPFTLLVLLLML